MSVKQAFENFMSNDFESAVISSTKAGWGGSGYSVELFDNGTYRVLWDNEIGNLYNSPGLILSIPQLSNDDYDEKNGHYFDNAKQEMQDWFKENWEANQNVQAIVAES